MMSEVLFHRNYFTENYWRQQGGQLELGFIYSNGYIEALDVNIFTTRHKIADAASSTPERLFSGISLIPQTKEGNFGLHTVYLYDLKNTIDDVQLFSNRAHSFSGNINQGLFEHFNLSFETVFLVQK